MIDKNIPIKQADTSALPGTALLDADGPFINPAIESILQFRDALWSGPLILLLVFTGLYQTIQLRGLQFRYLFYSLKLVFVPRFLTEQSVAHTAPVRNKSKKSGDLSSFQSLMTALAGAIGTGNVTGIATAVVSGGIGALFWMWVIALFGMATAYSEALLAVKFRDFNQEGHACGGPMYTLKNGLKSTYLAMAFALFGAIAAFGIGNLVQANSVADAVYSVHGISKEITGGVMVLLLGAVVLGGINSIGRLAGYLVPFMAVAYLGAGFAILGVHADQILPAFGLILRSAFTGQAAVGGFLGSTLIMALQQGVSKGVFSNEAGLGSLSIAAATAQAPHPAQQGFFAISGVFISTMLVCTITGLVLAVTQVLGSVTPTGELITGSALALDAFASVYPPLKYLVFIALVLFAFTTTLAWAYYGEKCVEFLCGTRIAYGYRWLYTGVVYFGAVLELELVWGITEIANGLMAIPNLIAIILLSRVVKTETRDYLKHIK
ncbi:MAG: D-alanine/glycine transport protein sodium-dependent [Pseudomonadota bacterium]|jgi:AGCS family alanine or glycine:cation symporter